jgi:hypothetical protein
MDASRGTERIESLCWSSTIDVGSIDGMEAADIRMAAANVRSEGMLAARLPRSTHFPAPATKQHAPHLERCYGRARSGVPHADGNVEAVLSEGMKGSTTS